METGDSRSLSPPGGFPKPQRGGRGNLGGFDHLGLPGEALAILAHRGCRLGKIGRSTYRGGGGGL
jgi:hypothetical protein